MAGEVWGIPDLGAARYLLDLLFEVGPVQSTGMGLGPLSWQEIMAFALATNEITEPWELRALRTMSEAYLAELDRGKSLLCIAPADRG